MSSFRGKSSPSRASGLVLEVTLVILIGGSLAFAANSLSPRGLALGRDYFPPAALPPTPPDPSPQDASPRAPAATPTTTHAATPAHEFASVSRAEVEEMTRDPRFATRQLLLIDARNAATYQAGHIPGALQFDHYRPEQHIAVVLPACLAAETIVLYCNGGSCEDSHYAARLLRDFGVPPGRLAIFESGFQDWQAAGLPVQSGNP